MGLTAQFETGYLKTIMDHHFSALRMTELAAGTDPTRDVPVNNAAEGTANTPGYAASPPKSQVDSIKSLSRRNNRMQREEIATAQRFLQDWYGISYEPTPNAMQRQQIGLLEAARPGAEFDRRFLETFSRHHYIVTTLSNECLDASNLKHHDLKRYCNGIVHGQVNDIDNMRQILCERFQVCDYQPLFGVKGRHSSSQGEHGGDTG